MGLELKENVKEQNIPLWLAAGHEAAYCDKNPTERHCAVVVKSMVSEMPVADQLDVVIN